MGVSPDDDRRKHPEYPDPPGKSVSCLPETGATTRIRTRPNDPEEIEGLMPMTPLWILSDLHLEAAPFPDAYDPPRPAFDVLVAAGDIWRGEPEKAVATIKRLAAGRPAVFVAGNHEPWGMTPARCMARLKRAAKGTGVTVLDGEAAVIAGVRFIGATLWADGRLSGLQLRPRQTTGEGVLSPSGQGTITHGDEAVLHAAERLRIAVLLEQDPGDRPKMSPDDSPSYTHHTWTWFAKFLKHGTLAFLGELAMTDPVEALWDRFPFLKEKARQWYDEWAKKNKKANILIVGKTGVGKSTLINAVFRDELAKTGTGRPVTQAIEEITKPGVPIIILDTKGLELAAFEEIRGTLIAEISSRRGEDPDKYVHLAWLCISEESKRVEDAEIELARELTSLGIEVIIVITKANKINGNEFKREIAPLFQGISREICVTRGVVESLYGDDDEVIGTRKVAGIDELISTSYRYIPDSQKQSFANTLSIKHRQSIEVKKSEAAKAIITARAAAAATGASPIPFSDAFLLIPIQSAMIVQISRIFGMSIDSSAVIPVVAALTGSTITTVLGKTIVTGILKFIPGIGTIAGGLISGAVAQELTAGMGNLYVSILSDTVESGSALEFSSAIETLKKKIGL